MHSCIHARKGRDLKTGMQGVIFAKEKKTLVRLQGN
jgi:hypothetical protein